MEIQEAYTRAFLGVLMQGRLASTSSGGCFYEIAGARCGVGQLLDAKQLAEVHKFEINSAPVARLVSQGVLPESFRHEFFTELQSAHDGARDLHEFIERMKWLGENRNLTVPSDEIIEGAYTAGQRIIAESVLS